MRSSLSLLLLMALLAAAPSGALPEPSAADREEALNANRRLLEKWRADPGHYARLQRDLAAFRALPPERRQQLRQLDRELHQQKPATQQRLRNVLERYHAWLGRLPQEQRDRIKNAADWHERLRLVKDFREQEWLQRQPAAVRVGLERLPVTERSKRLAQLRAEQRQRLRLALAPFKPELRKPTRLNEFPLEVRQFVRDSLRPLLTHEERRQLDQAEGKPWPLYARTLVSLAHKHPIPLPGPIGPVRLADLPEKVRERIHKFPNREVALQRQEGKWPEFGLTLLQPPGRKKPLPNHPAWAVSRLEDFAPALREFATTGPLGKALTAAEQKELKKAEGKWPDYPRTLLKLARKHKLTLPGMTLPVPKDKTFAWPNP